MNTTSEPIQWGVIGCGDVVKRKSGPAFHQSDRSDIYAVVSSDGTSAEAYATAHDVPIATADVDRVITDPDVDAVYVATPPNTHKEYTIAGAEAGKPVLVEKPLGLSAVEAKAMVEACGTSETELFVAYYRRFHPQIQKMRCILDDGAIGNPTHAFVDYSFPTPADSGWRESPAVSGGGWFVDATSHRLDLLVSLLGPPQSVTGTVRPRGEDPPVEAVVSLSSLMSDEVLCTVVSDFADASSSDAFRIHGTRGSITTTALDEGTFSYEMPGETGTIACEMPDAPHDGLIAHVEAVLLDGARNQCAGHSALQTEVLLDAGVRQMYADAIPADVWSTEDGDVTAFLQRDST